MNYKTYAEAKIANPDCEIVTTAEYWEYDKETIGTFEVRTFDNDDGAHIIEDTAWKICHPADYCSTLKEFLEAGFKLVEGDRFLGMNSCAYNVGFKDVSYFANYIGGDECRYILSAAALNGGCKIPDVEPWTIYNNTLPLSELSDEQAAQLFNAWRKNISIYELDAGEWINVSPKQLSINGVYRIKQKSERELFIENTTKVMRDAGTKCPDNHEYFGIMFDAGARYKDLTQFFGENI